MDKSMQRVTRQIINIAKEYKDQFNYNTISEAINRLNQGVKIQSNYKKAALSYLVENDFLDLNNGIYIIKPKLINFTTWAAYKKSNVRS